MSKEKKLNTKEYQLVGSDENPVGGSSCSTDTAAMANTSSGSESKPQICKLNDDCFGHLLEWLSLKELLVFRHTCKRMKAVVDHYIKFNYPRLLHKIICNSRMFQKFYQMRLVCFEWIRHLKVSITLNDTQIDSIKSVLHQLESLVLYQMQIDGNLYEALLKYCPHLRYLSVQANTTPKMIIGTGNEWLLREYPTLEHFQIRSGPRKESVECAELLTFFNQNPNVRIFSTDDTFLSMNRDIFLATTVKLDRLGIYVDDDDLISISNLTNDLHEQGFYKQLHLKAFQNKWISEGQLQQLWTFSNVEKLSVRGLFSSFPAPKMECIKELSFVKTCLPFSNIPMEMAMNLVNLKRINMHVASLHNIWQFVCYAPKLTQIRIYHSLVANNGLAKPNFSDFVELNEEHKKLTAAHKVTIYAGDEIFLKMKWSAKINLSMIELKRIELYEENEFYD